jgi:hypothetical protein
MQLPSIYDLVAPSTPQFGGAASTAAAQTELTQFTCPDPTPSGGASPYTYAWSWLKQPGSNTFSNIAIAQPTVTPDAVGVWTAMCTVTDSLGSTFYYVYSVVVGLFVAEGVYAKVLVSTDYTAEANQDIVGGGAFTIGGVSANSSVGTAPDVWALVNGLGLHFQATDGSGTESARLAYDLAALGVLPGDTVIFELAFEPIVMNDNDDRVFAALTQSNAGLGTDYSELVFRRVGASDYAWYARASVAGLFKDGTLDTSLPGNVRVAIVAGDRQSDARCDLVAGGLTTPNAITFRAGLRNTDAQANARTVGSREGQTTANLFASIIAVAQGSDAEYVFTHIRIAHLPARGAV